MKSTPQKKYPNLAQILKVPEVWIKEEYLNKSGSHKIRLINFLFQKYVRQGKKDFTISSSGNAAIAAAYYLQKIKNPQLNLSIFISPQIEKSKWQRLLKVCNSSPQIKIKKARRPKQEAFIFAQKNKAIFLRGSTEPQAEKAYKGLGQEMQKIPNLQAIFVPTSSGLTALGVSSALSQTKNKTEIHIVQTAKIHPFSANFDSEFNPQETSLASAIVDQVGKRKKEIIEMVKRTKGWGWTINDQELKNARKIVELNTNLGKINYDSLLSIAGLIKAQKNGWNFERPVCCLFTGI
ncbi:PLP-dependent lyase/thiolase [Patescibacteria group bacterium]|nr:PLP-dependent lyase/thiolase [Patescibacteria group bacterium]